MKESISKFITEGKALLWIKTNDFQEVERAMIESLNSLENKKFYIYEKGKTINFLNDSIESGMDDLFNTLDELHPQGMRKIPVFLLIKGAMDEILKENNLDYFREILEIKKESTRYNFSIVVADNEDIPTQLANISDFIDKKITDNEGAIKKYILDLAKFEKLELDENDVEKIINTLKNNINRYAEKNGRKNSESKFKDMVFVQGGKYQPSFADEEKEVFDIEVCKYLTTQKMWREYSSSYNPSEFKGENRPVERISWSDALNFCNYLSEKYCLQPVYENRNGSIMVRQLSGKVVSLDLADFKDTEGFRLPTELEWEWFARGGQKAIDEGTFNYKYSGSDDINEVAWYYDNSGNQTHDVGLKKPNQLGLYDCTGNVWEWCYDTTKYKNFEGESENRIEKDKLYVYNLNTLDRYQRIRGGGWSDSDWFEPDWSEPGYIDYRSCTNRAWTNYIGFRVVRTV